MATKSYTRMTYSEMVAVADRINKKQTEILLTSYGMGLYPLAETFHFNLDEQGKVVSYEVLDDSGKRLNPFTDTSLALEMVGSDYMNIHPHNIQRILVEKFIELLNECASPVKDRYTIEDLEFVQIYISPEDQREYYELSGDNQSLFDLTNNKLIQ